MALHGQAWFREWYGDGGIVALKAESVARLDLDSKVVFAESCHVPDSPMLAALFDAGAAAVIGAPGENWGGVGGLAGSSLLGWGFRVFWQKGLPPSLALALAKVIAMAPVNANRADLQGFQVYRRHDG